MKAARQKMKCHRCGGDMNHHADKIDYAIRLESKKPADAPFDGVIQEFHTCPKCGASAMRHGA